MKRALLLLLFTASTFAQLRPVHTYSIVARDPQTGELGVAVQSHWFSVGQLVPWAEAGVGAVATQSFVDPSYGKLGLDLMRARKSAPATLLALVNGDDGRNVRQVAMVDAVGRSAAYTGCKGIQAAGQQLGALAKAEEAPVSVGLATEEGCRPAFDIGRDFSVQANLMLNDKVWAAMANAYKSAKGDLAERMLQALEAGQAAGGDIRGMQSAALIVVRAQPSGKPWRDRIFDLRVDDHAEPLKELRRLVKLQRAYNHMNAGDEAVEHKDNAAALREYAAAEALIASEKDIHPNRLAEMRYWHAVALVNMGRVEESLPLFKQVFAANPNWRTLTPRLPKSELLPDDKKLIERITAQ
jgi:uncharacterized Ntn-hydrolase superfamily protein